MWRRNLYISWITQVISLAGFQLALPFIPYYIQELGVTDPTAVRVWTGVLAGGPALSFAIMAPIWGLLADRWGKKLMLLRATLSGAVIMVAMSLVHSIEGLLVLRILQGMLTGTVGATATLVATGTPKKRMSYALGFLSSSTFIGVSLGPMIGGAVAEWVGYRVSFRIGAALLMVAFVLILTMVEEVGAREPRPNRRARKPGTPRPAESSGGIRQRLVFLASATMIGLFVVLMILRFARAMPIPFLPLYIQEVRGQLDGSAGVTGLISAARGLLTAVAALTVTRLGDRVNRLPLVALLLGIGGLLTIPIFFTGTLIWFSVFLVAATFFVGGVEPMIQAELSTRTPASNRGLMFGVQTTVASLGWFLAPLVGSWVSIRQGIPHIFFLMAAALMLAALVVLLVHRLRRR